MSESQKSEVELYGAIQWSLIQKYSGPVYVAAAILDSVREDGVTFWLIQYSETISGKRRADLDIKIAHNSRTNVSGVR